MRQRVRAALAPALVGVIAVLASNIMMGCGSTVSYARVGNPHEVDRTAIVRTESVQLGSQKIVVVDETLQVATQAMCRDREHTAFEVKMEQVSVKETDDEFSTWFLSFGALATGGGIGLMISYPEVAAPAAALAGIGGIGFAFGSFLFLDDALAPAEVTTRFETMEQGPVRWVGEPRACEGEPPQPLQGFGSLQVSAITDQGAFPVGRVSAPARFESVHGLLSVAAACRARALAVEPGDAQDEERQVIALDEGQSFLRSKAIVVPVTRPPVVADPELLEVTTKCCSSTAKVGALNRCRARCAGVLGAQKCASGLDACLTRVAQDQDLWPMRERCVELFSQCATKAKVPEGTFQRCVDACTAELEPRYCPYRG